jgi:hypothetical protein
MSRLEQLWEHRWPSGADQAIGGLQASPAELAERYNLDFRPGADDFDRYIQVGLRLPSGRVLQLLRYTHDPSAGTMVFADRADHAGGAREELISTLDMDAAAFQWLEE